MIFSTAIDATGPGLTSKTKSVCARLGLSASFMCNELKARPREPNIPCKLGAAVSLNLGATLPLLATSTSAVWDRPEMADVEPKRR
jgi:hypothetical protein